MKFVKGWTYMVNGECLPWEQELLGFQIFLKETKSIPCRDLNKIKAPFEEFDKWTYLNELRKICALKQCQLRHVYIKNDWYFASLFKEGKRLDFLWQWNPVTRNCSIRMDNELYEFFLMEFKLRNGLEKIVDLVIQAKLSTINQ